MENQVTNSLRADESDHRSMETTATLNKDNPRPLPLAAQTSTTSYEFIGNLIEARGEAFFVDGSRYKGTWDALGMAGAGSYRMPHGVLYEGEIRDGMNHGNGSLEYPGKQIIDGVWNFGELKKLRYTFGDGLIYDKDNWNYCRFPDRRFNQSKIKGLNPGGATFKTQCQPTKVIPLGCYDSGDGIFDPSTLCVTNFDQPSKIVRIPTTDDCKWIMKHCRRGGTVPTGYRPWLNENWSSSPPKLPYRLPFSHDSPEKWWKRISTFERDKRAIINESKRRRSLENNYQSISRSDESCDSERLRKSVCTARELRSESQEFVENDICFDADGNSEELFVEDLNSLRHVICEEINYGEYEGEEEEDENLLMTVCCPPPDTYKIFRQREKSLQVSISEEKIQEQELEKEELKVEEEEGVEEEKEEEEEEEESESGENVTNLQEIREQSSESEESTFEWEEEDLEYSSAEEEYYFDAKISEEESITEELSDSMSSISERSTSESSDESEKRVPVEQRKATSRAPRKIVKKVPKPKKQKKRPCPDVIDKDELLQRKVGDLLFSPALEAPRSPVHLIRKKCDNKLCRKSNVPKHNSKCGGDGKPMMKNLSKKKHATHVCHKKDKKLSKILKNDENKICLNSKLFVTSDN